MDLLVRLSPFAYNGLKNAIENANWDPSEWEQKCTPGLPPSTSLMQYLGSQAAVIATPASFCRRGLLPVQLELLRCVGKAVVKNAAKSLLKCIPFGEILYDIANDTLEEWRLTCRSGAERRIGLEMLVQADPALVRQQAEAVALSVATLELRAPLAEYLQRLPSVIRRSLSHPEDLSGRTAPAGLPLDKPEDLVPFLPPRPPRFRPGDRPTGLEDWVLEELLGVGGFGEVWKAKHRSGHVAALKFCVDDESAIALQNEAALLDRIQRERLGGNGLVRLLERHLHANPPCLIYEYIPGGDLTRLIRCWHSCNPSAERLVREALRMLRTLARTLAEAHQLVPAGVVHRDMKPSNILLQPVPTGDDKNVKVWLRIADFGIGDVASRQAMARTATTSAKEVLTTSIRGAHTPLYASPQQKMGLEADPRDDVWALGVIGYQTLTGDTTSAPPPWMRKELQNRGTPAVVCDVLELCLIEDADDRPSHAGVLVESISGLLAELPQLKGTRRSK